MRVKKLHFVDYKRFHDLTIDLGERPARIVALVGPNGCGKSSVFDGMLYINNAYGAIGGSRNTANDYRYHSLNQESNYNYQKNSIEFDEGSLGQIKEKLAITGAQNTVFSFRSSFRYSNTLNVTESRTVDDIKQNNYGATTAAGIDSRIDQSYRRLKIKYDKYLNEQDCKPSEAKAHIIGELNKAISSCLSIEIDNLGSIEDGKGTLYFRKADVNNPFAYDVLSSGEKEVVDILLDLYLRKDSYINSVYIIDEPELHLNTAIQRKLLVEIDKMIPENCQIWVATHSIGFIRALQEELNAKSQVIRFQADNKWASEAYILKPIVKNRAAWQDLFQTALDDMTKLVAPRTIIYCEGRDFSVGGIERGLDAIVFNNIFGTKYPDVLFISSGGNTELDKRSTVAIAVLSKALPDTEILVLKDRDMASGKETDEDMRQQYLLNNPAYHRVLKRREIENYLYDKDVLKKYCSSNGYTFDESAYDAFVTDIVNQNVKDETTRIKNICGIQVSINPETFKKNISNFFDEDMVVYKELEQEIFKRQ